MHMPQRVGVGQKTASSPEMLPTVLVIFGATGDLARRRLIPALFYLYKQNLLPQMFHIVGFSRQELTNEEFEAHVRKALEEKGEKDPALIKKFSSRCVYVHGFFDKRNGYDKLADFLGFKNREWQVCANKLFYLAVPPAYYPAILPLLRESGLTDPCAPEEGWTRVVVEKPFGRDLKTAEELDALLGKLFSEEQVYRIDHYLGKETVQNILAFRFSNSFLEPAWNKGAIEEIRIRMYETIGVEGRGEFYDGIGALRDVGQNHLLQLLALFTMENPGVFSGERIREKRAEVLRSLKIFSPRDAGTNAIRGQYEGYKNEPGVAPDSETETYFRIKAFVEAPRWSGVPMYLEHGKKLSENRAEVEITFKHQTPCLCPQGIHYKNVLRYHIQPKEGIETSFWVKKPGTEMVLEEKDFSFDYQSAYPKGSFLDAYERLMLDAIRGNQTLFVSTKELLASWKFIDPILDAWRGKRAPLETYRSGSKDILEKQLREDATSVAVLKNEMVRRIGFVGLGKMGKNIALRLREKGWRVFAFDSGPASAEDGGIQNVSSIRELTEALAKPRVIWLMVPHAEVETVIFGARGLVQQLDRGDIVIDGGNSFFEDSVRRAKRLRRMGIHFLDVGVSGGPEGARNGACLMIGGEKGVFEELRPLLEDLAAPQGYAHVGNSGAGHFAKMIHNGIEYGMMQSLAEGFAVMKRSPFALDLKKISDLYNHGSVIESRLVGWLGKAFGAHGGDLIKVSGSVAHTGEGEWTVKTAKKLGVSAPIIKGAFRFRRQSAKKPSYVGKILTALRAQFGGHNIRSKR